MRVCFYNGTAKTRKIIHLVSRLFSDPGVTYILYAFSAILTADSKEMEKRALMSLILEMLSSHLAAAKSLEALEPAIEAAADKVTDTLDRGGKICSWVTAAAPPTVSTSPPSLWAGLKGSGGDSPPLRLPRIPPS